MRSLGILLVVLGIGSLLLPMFDLQFTLLTPLEPYQPIAGIVVAAIGAVLVFLSMRRTTTVQPPDTTGRPG